MMSCKRINRKVAAVYEETLLMNEKIVGFICKEKKNKLIVVVEEDMIVHVKN